MEGNDRHCIGMDAPNRAIARITSVGRPASLYNRVMVSTSSDAVGPATREALNTIMERASAALADRDYAGGEAACVEALAAARRAGDWAYYHRILLPLQECRRQRRMIAVDAGALLGTFDRGGSGLVSLLDERPAGCAVVTNPHKPTDAGALRGEARARGLNWQVLFAETGVDAQGGWRVIAMDASGRPPDPEVSCVCRPPLEAWRGRWVEPGGDRGARHRDTEVQALSRCGSASAADWFLDATEALGDAAIASVRAPLGGVERVAALEALLACVPDHEKLHQRLADAARALA